jgi:hypothetical protein
MKKKFAEPLAEHNRLLSIGKHDINDFKSIPTEKRAGIYFLLTLKPCTMQDIKVWQADRYEKVETYSTSCRDWAENYGLIAKDSKGRWHSLLPQCASYNAVVADGTIQPEWRIGDKPVRSDSGDNISKPAQSIDETFPAMEPISEMPKSVDEAIPAMETISELTKEMGLGKEIVKANIEEEKNNKLPDAQSIESDISQLLSNNNISNTEREASVLARIGQGKFRQKLKEYWGKCAVTGCAEFGILRASHIKPWADCNNQERLDHFNGLLLIPNLDSLFDQGLISFSDDGNIIISKFLSDSDRKLLGVSESMKINLAEGHKKYLITHRKNILKKFYFPTS